jgi:hypothetical protein
MPEDQALQRLQEILARSDYQTRESQPWWQQLLAPIWDFVVNSVERLIVQIVSASSGREGWVGLAILAFCLVLIGIVGLYLIRAVRISVRRENSLRSQTLAERRERSERLWQTAQQLAAAGEWSEAVRVVYLSALYALDERALLHVETSLTNREHVRELDRLHPDLALTFSDVVENYDRLRYGRFPLSETTFADLSQRVARARNAALGGAQAA